MGGKSNECVWQQQRVVIKSGHRNTRSIGVLYHMAPRLDAVLGAFEDEHGSYRVLHLPIERCLPLMKSRPTRSQGPSAGRVGMVRRSVFESEGNLVAIVKIDQPQID